MGREVKIPDEPNRIVSLVPSQTEYLFDLGLSDRVLGATKFCIHPQAEVEKVQKIGGTKTPDLELIRDLKPDLIIGNKEENRKEHILELEREFPVWLSDVVTLESAYEMMHGIAQITGKQTAGNEIIQRIKRAFSVLKPFEGLSVLYLIWGKPYMGVGSNAFIHHMLEYIGFKNALSDYSRYPELSEDQMIASKPDLVFLSSEPYPFREKHDEYVRRILPKARVIHVDGEIFSWYGSRLLQAPGYLEKVLHPQI